MAQPLGFVFFFQYPNVSKAASGLNLFSENPLSPLDQPKDQ